MKVLEEQAIMLTPFFWVALFQHDPVRPFEAQTMVAAAQARAMQEQQRQASSLKQRGFEQKFNELVNALSEFVRKYNGAQGQVWPAKEAEALRNALREVERALPASANVKDHGSETEPAELKPSRPLRSEQ
jgi:hypothetical protein